MIGLILRIKGIEKVNCSLDFYVERDRALHFEKGDLVFVYDNGPEYYVCIDTDKVGRGALKCRAVIVDGERKVAVSGYTGFTIPCMGEGATISCGGYLIEFSEAENLPQGGDVPDVDWPDGSNLDDYTTDGVYSIRGNRVEGDNIPILNDGPIAARLTVLTSDDNGGNKVVTQVLTLNNNAGGEGNVYVRSSQEGHWKPWGKLQTNIEVGQVTTLDNLVDNGIYSGVSTDGSPTAVGSFYDTFVLIVLNNYSVAGPLGVSQSISQLKYSLKLDATIEVAKRKRDEFGNWTEWESVGGGSAAIEAQAPLLQKDGKLSLNIGDGLKVENEKLVAVPQSSGGNALRALFVAAGAEYNDTGVDIIKTTPWAEYVDNQDILNVSASDVKTIVQGGTTYNYVIDNGVYKVVLTDLLGNIRHNERYCIHRAGHYYLNGLGDITEEQMMAIYAKGELLTVQYNLLAFKGRTHLYYRTIQSTSSITGYYYAYLAQSEVVNFYFNASSITNFEGNSDRLFGQCRNLKYINGAIRFNTTALSADVFNNTLQLRVVQIYQLKSSISLSHCEFISKKSVLYAINNSTATTAITITLHANAFARLKDNPEIVSALANKPLVTLVSA